MKLFGSEELFSEGKLPGLSRKRKSLVWRCTLVIGMTVCALGIQEIVESWLGHEQPFWMCYVAVAVVAMWAGSAAAIATAALAFAGAAWFFIEPQGIGFAKSTSEAWVQLGAYGTVCGTIIALTHYARNMIWRLAQVNARLREEIAGRVRGEQAQRMLASIVESSGDAILSVGLDGRVLTWNWGAERLFGYKAEEIIGEPIGRLVPPERQGDHRFFLEKLKHGERVESFATKRVSKEGRLIEVSMTVSPIFNSAGRVIAGSAIIRDVTEPNRVAEELQVRGKALDAAANAIVITDSDGKIRWLNPAFEQLTGYSALEAVGRTPSILKSGEMGREVYASMWRMISRGEVWHGEVVNRRKNGTLYTEEMTIAPVKNSSGEVIRYIAIKQDITKRKEAEEALQASEERYRQLANKLDGIVRERTAKLAATVQELEHFSYTITHDMRAPLRAMQGFGNLLAEACGECSSALQRDLIRRIVLAAERMDHLITDALDYSMAVREELPIEMVDPRVLLRGIVETYPQFGRASADIEVEGEFEPVMGNEAALTQCFSNLLGNAVKFVRPGQKPRVSVRAEQRDSFQRIWFEDNGIGIPEDQQRKIFGMFQRVSRDYEGTGIGLALVRKMTERMSGRVGVESTPGRGSRFWLELPLALSERQPAEVAESGAE